MPLAPGTLDLLERTPDVLRVMLTGLPDELLERRDAGGWTPRDVVAHLLSLEGPAMQDRIRLLLQQPNPDVRAVNEHETLEASGHRAKPLAELLAAFAGQRWHTLEGLRSLSEADRLRGGQHPHAGPITVADVIHHIAYHDAVHIRQLAAMLAAPAEASRGRMRDID